MRIHKICLALFVVPLLLLLLPTSCSKTEYTIIKTTADSATQIITSGDEMNINYEFDQGVNEALLATSLSRIAGGDSLAGSVDLFGTISQVTIDTSHINDSAQIRLSYFGKNADQTKGRTGDITVHFTRDNNGKIIPWKTPGATITLTFTQYEVVILANNKSLWMNGTATITNLSGGLLKKPASISLHSTDSLQDRVKGNITFTYNDNVTLIQTWTWNMYQLRTFNMPTTTLTSTIIGDTTVNTSTGVSTSGTTRFGYVFYTQILSPVVQSISSSYLLSNPLSGEKAIHGIQEPMQVDYGVDANGNAVLSGTPYGYKISWIGNGGQAVTVVKY